MKKFLILTFVLVFNAVSSDEAVVKIDKGVMKPTSIAVYQFFDDGSSFGEQASMIVKNDLTGSGLFQIISQQAYLQTIKSMNEKIAYQSWGSIGAQYLLIGSCDHNGWKLSVKFRLYDTILNRTVCEYTINGTDASFRKMAHMVSNYVYKHITGDEGYFNTRVSYVSIARRKDRRKIHRLAIMDHDGYNHKFLTDGTNIVLTPRSSPDKDEIIFFSYGEKIVKGRRLPLPGNLYKYSFATGKITPIFSSPVNMNYAPRYSPDGKKMIFSMSIKGSSSIYEMDIASKNVKRLTYGRNIDTSPCYSPDMKYIVFNSDRGGSQQLYIMNSDGSNARRLSYGSGRYATPVWSPRGDWIAFTKFGGGKFYIGVMKHDGNCEKLLARGYLVEGPTWSPNGRVVMFSHQDRSGIEKIHSIDVTGFNQREIITPVDGIDPEWVHPVK